MRTALRPRLTIRVPALAGRPADALTAGLFALFLAAPLVGAVALPARQPENEKRPLHPPPYFPDRRWKAQTFPTLFDAYYKDRVGGRAELLRLRQRLLVEHLGDSITDDVWLGHDGWLFINCAGPPAVRQQADRRLRARAAAFDDRRRWLAARGIRYAVLVIPEKSDVYPEHLPAAVRRHPPPDALAALRPLVPELTIVDPLPAMRAAKERAAGPLFYRTDTHWTADGAFVAYQELGRALAGWLPGYRPRPLSAFARHPDRRAFCDLSVMLGRPAAECTEPADRLDDPARFDHLRPADAVADVMSRRADRLAHVTPTASESPAGVGRLLLLHDSFGDGLREFLWADFRRLAAVGTYGLPEELVAAERPDVVVQLTVARYLVFPRTGDE